MEQTYYLDIIKRAWSHFNGESTILSIEDLSPNVSTNFVFRVNFEQGSPIIAKISEFGDVASFVDDHKIINTLANNLRYPFDQFIARTLNKGNRLFYKRYKNQYTDSWIVFYNPIRIKKKPPKKFKKDEIIKAGKSLAKLHLACSQIRKELPESTKTLETDILDIKRKIYKMSRYKEDDFAEDEIDKQCEIFLKNYQEIGLDSSEDIPVFIDWNIGNFSVDNNLNFFSRWDYDWFRVSNRVMDFYFWSRVVRAEGDQDTFSYTIAPMEEDRFLVFLKAYHKIYPLTLPEVKFIKESYRFFILHYVVHLGDFFFRDSHAGRLKKETFSSYFKSIESFDTLRIIKALKIPNQ